MNPILLILDGVTGAGKSTVVDLIREYEPSIRFGAKFTTRPRRPTDSDGEFHFVDEIPSHVNQYAYKSVGWEYAVNVEELDRTLRSGSSYLLTCTDPQIISSLTQAYATVVVYVYRNLSASDLLALMKERHTTPEDIKRRQDEVESTLKAYSRALGLYDFVILNTGTLGDLRDQITMILSQCSAVTQRDRSMHSAVTTPSSEEVVTRQQAHQDDGS